MEEKISNEYIRGLIEGEGCFTFSTNTRENKDGKIIKEKIPAFSLRMSTRDLNLVISIKNTLRLHNKVYQYKPRIRKDGYQRDGMAILIVREFGQLKNIIVPFFYKKLKGNKRRQFDEWLEKIGSDSLVSEHFKFIYKIYKAGFYDKIENLSKYQ